jgi:acetone carboxylase gamma subunit
MKVDKQMLADLVDERLDRHTVKAIQSGYKDPARFDTYLELLQERAPWDDRIVLRTASTCASSRPATAAT